MCGGYGGRVRRAPDAKEPRAPAVAIWTFTGAFAGLAAGVVLSNLVLLVLIGGLLGLAFGMYTTRQKQTPTDD